jgi:hypothetical protein
MTPCEVISKINQIQNRWIMKILIILLKKEWVRKFKKI